MSKSGLTLVLHISYLRAFMKDILKNHMQTAQKMQQPSGKQGAPSGYGAPSGGAPQGYGAMPMGGMPMGGMPMGGMPMGGMPGGMPMGGMAPMGGVPMYR